MNYEKLAGLTEGYRGIFWQRWEEENFKWRAVKVFQEKWDLEAEDFPRMLGEAFAEAGPLFYYNGYGMLKGMAERDPEAVREMFRALYDETQDVTERMERFMAQSASLVAKYREIDRPGWKNHFQDGRAVSAYLSFRYPEKYFFYLHDSTVRFLSKVDGELLKTVPKAEQPAFAYRQYEKVIEFWKREFADWLREVREGISEDCWPDENYHILLADFVFFVGRKDKTDEAATEDEDDAAETLEAEEATEQVAASVSEYNDEDFLREVYVSREQLANMKGLLERKKNLILAGAPGVGKTFAAKRLAYAMMGAKDAGRVEMVQFHQSYSYEDFVLGFRPQGDGFRLEEGVFYRFCERARKDRGRGYFFIIDEINRGNLSKIFGELLMLIEADKRESGDGEGERIQLAYQDERHREAFGVPENVYIIGMMNTADRSLAMIDYALRRRFCFVEMKPAFESERFRAYIEEVGSQELMRKIETVKELNRAIREDETLGEGFEIGHSYFCNLRPGEATAEGLRRIVDFEILPMLKEYWFDRPEKYEEWKQKLAAK